MPRRPAITEFTLTSPDLVKAEDLLKEGERFLERAQEQLRGDHAESVARSSRTIELSAKALLALSGFTFPRRHDVGVGLVCVWRSLDGQDWEQVQLAKRQVARVGWLCDVVEPMQVISEYGYTEKRPVLILNETDASVFYQYGKECLDIARRIARSVQSGSLRTRP